MGISFEKTWDSRGKRITKTETATDVINSAVAALNGSNQMEIITWCSAALSDAPTNNGNFLKVEKSDHQLIGLVDRTDHLTMRVCIKNQQGERAHGLYHGAFHLEIQLPDPNVGDEKQILIPVQISYRGADNQIHSFQIANAASVESDI